MSFWDVVWFIFISYIFVAYLMLLFSIFSDLFRDSDANGFVKAMWCVALIVLPFLSALIYLIVRGKGMAARAQERMVAQRRQQDAYIRDVAGTSGGGTSAADQITQARALLDAGAISQPEYEALKTKALV